ncbi:MAG: NAD-dependent epimerase/dehydratase family protein, partial [Carnobacterium maltaromaticum]
NPESPYSGFISILVDRLKNEKELTIFGNGEQTRDFVYVEDVVNALLLIATSDKSRGQVYNVGTGSRITLNDLVKLSQEITGKKISIKFDKEREGDIRDSISDISKLRNIGYEPNVDLALGMKKYLEYEFKK